MRCKWQGKSSALLLSHLYNSSLFTRLALKAVTVYSNNRKMLSSLARTVGCNYMSLHLQPASVSSNHVTLEVISMFGKVVMRSKRAADERLRVDDRGSKRRLCLGIGYLSAVHCQQFPSGLYQPLCNTNYSWEKEITKNHLGRGTPSSCDTTL